eukprot:5968390-Prorocentrum_lima.AAC.1
MSAKEVNVVEGPMRGEMLAGWSRETFRVSTEALYLRTGLPSIPLLIGKMRVAFLIKLLQSKHPT